MGTMVASAGRSALESSSTVQLTAVDGMLLRSVRARTMMAWEVGKTTLEVLGMAAAAKSAVMNVIASTLGASWKVTLVGAVIVKFGFCMVTCTMRPGGSRGSNHTQSGCPDIMAAAVAAANVSRTCNW